MSLKKNECDFICEPVSVIITTKNSKRDHRLEVEALVNGKPALSGEYSIQDFSLEEAIKKVKVFCDAIQMFTEDELQEWVEADQIMRALYAYRFLEKVRTRTGKLIWEK